MYLSEKQGDSSITTYAIKKANEEILILGSSRASNHYNSMIIQDYLHLSCYNLGRSGMDIEYETIILKALVDRHKPKLLILDINPNELLTTKISKIPYLKSALLPYLNNDKIIKKELKKIDNHVVILGTISKLFCFNSTIIPIIQHAFNIGSSKINGFEAINHTMTDNPDSFVNNYPASIDSDKLASYREFVSICYKNKIKLIVVISPAWNIYKINSISLTKKIAYEFKYPVIDMSSTPKFHNQDLFSDEQHLNAKGANLFSSDLSLLLLNYKSW